MFISFCFRKSQSSNENSKHRRGPSSNSERANKPTTEVEHQTASTQKLNNNANTSGSKSRLDVGNSLDLLNQSGVSAALSDVGGHFSKQFFSNVSVGYNVLLHTFQYLKVQVSWYSIMFLYSYFFFIVYN